MKLKLFKIIVLCLIHFRYQSIAKRLKFCKRELLETYKLTSFTKPRTVNMYLCPSIITSCCSEYDQFTMYMSYRDKAKKILDDYYKNIERKMIDSKKLMEEFTKIDMKKLIGGLVINLKEKRKILFRFKFYKDRNILPKMDSMLLTFKKIIPKLMKIRSSFFCTICDFNTHYYIDTKRRSMVYNYDTCALIAEQTIEFSYLLNVKVAAVLIGYSKVISYFYNKNPDIVLKIHNFKKIRGNVVRCAKAI